MGFLFDDIDMGVRSCPFAGFQRGAILTLDSALARALHVCIRLPRPVLFLSKVARRNGYRFRPRRSTGPPLILLDHTVRLLDPALHMMPALNFDKLIIILPKKEKFIIKKDKFIVR